jgi:hypothetical protein
MAISDEKYVATTTFRKSGTPVPTPTWIIALDGGRVGFWTSSRSGKYKRLRAKYGVMVPMSKVFNTLGHLGKGKFPYGDVGVVITLGDPS